MLSETKVCINEINLFSPDLYPYPDGSSFFTSMTMITLKIPRFYHFHWQTTQNGISIFLFFKNYWRMKMMIHGKASCYIKGLINTPGPPKVNIKFLKSYNIRFISCNNPCYPLGRDPAVQSNTAVDIVSHDPEFPDLTRIGYL